MLPPVSFMSKSFVYSTRILHMEILALQLTLRVEFGAVHQQIFSCMFVHFLDIYFGQQLFSMFDIIGVLTVLRLFAHVCLYTSW